MSRLSIPGAAAAVLALAIAGNASAYQKAPPASPPPAASAAQAGSPKPAVKLVDLNRASVNELKALPGIGDAEAAKIVAARPFKSKADLVTKNVLTLEAYDRLSRQVVVDLRKPAAKPKS
jgi:DNA uptake protein ComE-like DNA-binding protein